MQRILITGATGQLGSEIEAIVGQEANYFFTDVAELDITNKRYITDFVQDNGIEVIVNCAAYTNVDAAEEEPQLADLINRQAVQNLAEVAQENAATLIHISTDYVFDGTQNTPYKETDKTNPLGVYGRTKWAGEQAIICADIPCLIIRTSWLYSVYGHNFVKTIQRLSLEKKELRVVFDQIGTPTYASDLAQFIVEIIKNNQYQNKKEIYHFSNEGVCSWYDFAKEIVGESKNECDVIPCYSGEYPAKVTRPSYSVLDKTKLRNDFNYKIPHWRDAFKRCMIKLKKQK